MAVEEIDLFFIYKTLNSIEDFMQEPRPLINFRGFFNKISFVLKLMLLIFVLL